MATAAPSPPPPLQQKDANAISPSELSPPCSTGLVPTPVVSGKAKQVAAKIATAAAALVDASAAAAAVLSERKCGGAGGIWAWAYFLLPSFTYYNQAAATLSWPRILSLLPEASPRPPPCYV